MKVGDLKKGWYARAPHFWSVYRREHDGLVTYKSLDAYSFIYKIWHPCSTNVEKLATCDLTNGIKGGTNGEAYSC